MNEKYDPVLIHVRRFTEPGTVKAAKWTGENLAEIALLLGEEYELSDRPALEEHRLRWYKRDQPELNRPLPIGWWIYRLPYSGQCFIEKDDVFTQRFVEFTPPQPEK